MIFKSECILNFSMLIASFHHHLVTLYVTSSNYRMILLTYSRGQIIDRKDFLKFFSCSFPFLYRQGFVNHHHIILIYKGSNVVQTPFPPRKFMFSMMIKRQFTRKLIYSPGPAELVGLGGVGSDLGRQVILFQPGGVRLCPPH